VKLEDGGETRNGGREDTTGRAGKSIQSKRWRSESLVGDGGKRGGDGCGGRGRGGLGHRGAREGLNEKRRREEEGEMPRRLTSPFLLALFFVYLLLLRGGGLLNLSTFSS